MEDVIELDSESTNELQFKLQIEGTQSSVIKARLACEGRDLDYVFRGATVHGEVDTVKFTVPPMKTMTDLDESLSARVEVVVEGRYFEPVNFKIKFKRPVKVVAEMVGVKPLLEKKTPGVSAVLVSTQKPKPPSVKILEQETPPKGLLRLKWETDLLQKTLEKPRK